MRKSSPPVSIIIPCKKIDMYVKECIEHCKRLDYKNYEILILPDHHSKELNGVKVIPTGAVVPGAKRNLGVANSKGEICAFIDSDAYPRRDWLKNAIKYFSHSDIKAIGGPGVTPEEDDYMQKASGFVLSSFLVGSLRRRYSSNEIYKSDDVHSCNFIVKREIMEKAKWNEKYWPGEDTLLSLELGRFGVKMLEAKDVLVYHHRRPLFKAHLKQISKFGLHRGFFFKKFPENSRKLTYMLPSLMVLYIIAMSTASLVNSFMMEIFMASLGIYLLITLIGALHAKEPKLIILTWVGIILTHLIYGAFYLLGLSKRSLER